MQYDIVIVGGGLVGTSAALAMSQQGFKVLLLEASNKPQVQPPDTWDSRIYAITPGNVEWLKSLDVWHQLDHARVCSIQQMRIWGDQAAQPLSFDAYEANTANLGVIVESSMLQAALDKGLQDSIVELRRGVLVEELQYSSDNVVLHLADGNTIGASLLIGADGGNSWVRQQFGIDVSAHPYEQSGLVANFETELPHEGIARQWFREDGILAWLPMPDKRISIVWSTPLAAELQSLDSSELAARVEAAGNHALGKLHVITPPAVFPLVKQTADQMVKPRLALVGDAAHRVHPLAGQGVNLGFRGVVELQKVLAQARRDGRDIGDFYVLRQYERARKTDVLAMGYVTHGLQLLFESPQPLLKQLRNWGLGLTNRNIFIKKQLTKHAMI